MAKQKPELQYIAVEHIHPHPDNPRKDLGDLTELTESIKKNGIMQNLTVIPGDKDGEYTALIGHRRLAAAKAAKLLTVPCKVVCLLTLGEQVAIMLEENMQRNDLTVLEQAQGFQMMLDLGSSVDEIAQKTGFSEQTVKHRLKIAQLDPKAIAAAEEDGYFQLTIKHYTMLEKLPTVADRNAVLRDSRDGRQLEYKINERLAEIERKENAAAIIAILEDNGIKAAPKNTNRWSGGYIQAECFDLREKPRKDIMKNLEEYDPATLVYLREYMWLYVLEIEKKKKTEKQTEREKEGKYNERRHKEVRALQKALEAQRREFILSLFRGVGHIDKEREPDLMYTCFNLMIECAPWVSVNQVAGYLYGGNWYDLDGDERDDYLEKAKQLRAVEKALILTDSSLQLRSGTDNGCVITWDGKKRFTEMNRLLKWYIILDDYFGYETPAEAETLLDGSHPLLRTYEEAKKDGDVE